MGLLIAFASVPPASLFTDCLFIRAFSGRIEVTCRSLGTGISQQVFKRPPPNQLPLIDFSLMALFQKLSVDNIFLLLSAVLTEKRYRVSLLSELDEWTIPWTNDKSTLSNPVNFNTLYLHAYLLLPFHFCQLLFLALWFSLRLTFAFFSGDC